MKSRANEAVLEIFFGWKGKHRLDMKEVTDRVKIPQRTLQRRLNDPGTLSLDEFRNIVEAARASDDEILEAVTGRRRT